MFCLYIGMHRVGGWVQHAGDATTHGSVQEEDVLARAPVRPSTHTMYDVARTVAGPVQQRAEINGL
jgi:hypothetical protein